MEIVRVDMPSKNFDCALAGDIHLGAVNCNYSLVEELIAELKNGVYLANIGDNQEAITPSDKRYAHASMDVMRRLLTPQAQAEHLIKMFRPVKKQILAWGEGNHEFKLANVLSLGQYISDTLGVPYGGFNYILQFYYKNRLQFKVFISHGAGLLRSNAKDPIQREGNMDAALKRKLEATGISDCIVMAMGHTHQLRVVEPTIDLETNLTTTRRQIKHRKRHETIQHANYISPERRWYVNTGSFLRLYATPGSRVFGYAERFLLRPTDLGWAVMEIRNGKFYRVRKRVG